MQEERGEIRVPKQKCEENITRNPSNLANRHTWFLGIKKADISLLVAATTFRYCFLKNVGCMKGTQTMSKPPCRGCKEGEIESLT